MSHTLWSEDQGLYRRTEGPFRFFVYSWGLTNFNDGSGAQVSGQARGGRLVTHHFAHFDGFSDVDRIVGRPVVHFLTDEKVELNKFVEIG